MGAARSEGRASLPTALCRVRTEYRRCKLGRVVISGDIFVAGALQATLTLFGLFDLLHGQTEFRALANVESRLFSNVEDDFGGLQAYISWLC